MNIFYDNGVYGEGEGQPMYDPYTDLEQTQQATQSQSQPSQPHEESYDSQLWGYLKPLRQGLTRIDFWRSQPKITIGRGYENLIVLGNLKVSNKHCTLEWDGRSEKDSHVEVLDLSTNGTYINGFKVGKGRTSYLRDGQEIAFGQHTVSIVPDEYRYIFRLTAAGRPTTGLYAFYDIGNELGRGSFASVMKAVHRETGESYAVKIIHLNRFRYSQNPGTDSVEKFMREIQILEKLDHPNICRLKESFRDETAISLVLELVPGGDLLEYIIKRNGVPEDEGREFSYQLSDALRYLHAMNVAHRDLKPENILVTLDVPPRLKIADFGLAKAVDSMTQFMTTCGTPIYLAPEVVLRDREGEAYSTVVDSWSVGAIVFSMLSNATPFFDDDDTPQSMEQRFRTRYIEWTPLVNKGVSKECEDFIRKLLKEDPRLRMTCAAALEHPWLQAITRREELRKGVTRREEPAMRQPLDISSFVSTVSQQAAAGSFSDQSFMSVVQTTPRPAFSAVAGMSGEFEQIRVADSESDIQPKLTPAVGRAVQKLERRHMEVAQFDAAGHLQAFRDMNAVSPAGKEEGEPSAPASPAVAAAAESLPTPVSAGDPLSAGTRKRKNRSMSVDEEANVAQMNADNGSTRDSSPLTPVSDDADDPAQVDGPSLRGANARRKVPAQREVRAGGRNNGATPAKRTRASARQRGQDADM